MKTISKLKAASLSLLTVAALSTSAQAATISNLQLTGPSGFTSTGTGGSVSDGSAAFGTSTEMITGNAVDGDWTISFDIAADAGETVSLDSWTLNISGVDFIGGSFSSVVDTFTSFTDTISVSGYSHFGVSANALVNISSVTAVPVPAAAWLLGSGVLAFAGMRRRQRNIEASAA